MYPQHVKRITTTIHARTGFKFLFVNYFKTETHTSVEGKNCFKAQPMGVNKLNNIVKDMTQATGISGKLQTTVVDLSSKTVGQWSSSQSDNSNNGA